MTYESLQIDRKRSRFALLTEKVALRAPDRPRGRCFFDHPQQKRITYYVMLIEGRPTFFGGRESLQFLQKSDFETHPK